MRRNLQIIVIVLAILSLLFGLIGAGWSQRPIIDYTMEGLPDNIDFGYQTLRVSLKYRNRGDIDASLLLVLTVTDANITVDTIEPWIDYNETQVKFHVTVISHMEGYANLEVSIVPLENAQNFTITYTFEDASDSWSINGIISHSFLEAHPYFPTLAMYNITGTNTYEWVK